MQDQGPRARARARARSGLAALVLLLVPSIASIACGGAQKGKGATAELRVLADPPSAVVQVNERFVGAARVLDKQPARLTPGPKRVTVEAPGYFPHDLELDLPAGTTTLNIKLRPIPP